MRKVVKKKILENPYYLIFHGFFEGIVVESVGLTKPVKR
jgi:hypothetical protein